MTVRKLFALVLGVIVFSCCTELGAAKRPLNGFFIMLDPGHGGSDPGAIGPGGLKESETNLRVSRYLRMLLEADGAKVFVTRSTDIAVSLKDRVDMANEKRPDLFVSIHHNASLKPKTSAIGPVGGENRGEIYFNALDRGLPLSLAKKMSDRLAKSDLVSSSKAIPGGFFVLRNNSVPAVLTEGSFISHQLNEKALRTGKALTNEAEVFRRAIRDLFATSALRVEFFSKEPVEVSNQYFKILLVSNKALAGADLEMGGPSKCSFHLERLPMLGNLYSLTNSRPLPTGDYQLTFNFRGADGSLSSQIPISLKVRLPIAKALLQPVAPYISQGFKGAFPLILSLKDPSGQENACETKFTLVYGKRKFFGSTRSDGKACIILDLSGKERDFLAVRLLIGAKTVSSKKIPILTCPEFFILGQICSSYHREGLEKVKIQYGSNRSLVTGPGGYFFCELPKIFKNLALKIFPPPGYVHENRWVRTGGNKISTPLFVLSPVAPLLIGKHIGVFIEQSSERWARFFTRELRRTGAKISRFSFSSKDTGSLDKQVSKVNRIPNIDLIISLKEESTHCLSLRHYHRSSIGKRLASALGLRLKKEKVFSKIRVEAGSDYELAHTGPVAFVVSIPHHYPDTAYARVVNAAIATLKEGISLPSQ